MLSLNPNPDEPLLLNPNSNVVCNLHVYNKRSKLFCPHYGLFTRFIAVARIYMNININLDLYILLMFMLQGKVKPKVSAGGWIYSTAPAQPQLACRCNYILHMPYSKMPQEISHPINLNQSQNPYPLSSSKTHVHGWFLDFFSRDACGKLGDGFSYHCRKCNVDLHPICLTMPLTLTTHHHHDLNLTFCRFHVILVD